MLAGRPDLAERAQRYAVPQLADTISILASEEVQKAHGVDLCKSMLTQITSVINSFPAFAGETQLDIGQARIVSIDLKGVINDSPTTPTDYRNNLLFFMIARELFMKKIAGRAKEIPAMRFPEGPAGDAYRTFWAERYTDIEQTRKRFCFDEFHITGSSPIMASQIDQDVRQGRKFGLEILLVSQRLQDFERYNRLCVEPLRPEGFDENGTGYPKRIFKADDSVTMLPCSIARALFPVSARRSSSDGPSADCRSVGCWPRTVWVLPVFGRSRPSRRTVPSGMRSCRSTSDLSRALEILAVRFPSGTGKAYWDRVAVSSTGKDIAGEIARTLYAEHSQ